MRAPTIAAVRANGIYWGLRGAGLEVEAEDIDALPVVRMTGEIGIDRLVQRLKLTLTDDEEEGMFYTPQDICEVMMHCRAVVDAGIVENLRFEFVPGAQAPIVKFEVDAPSLDGFGLTDSAKPRIVSAILGIGIIGEMKAAAFGQSLQEEPAPGSPSPMH